MSQEDRTTEPAEGTLLHIRTQARRLLADALPPGWDVRAIARESLDAVQLDLGPAGGGRGVALEWREWSPEEPVPALVYGHALAAAYRSAPEAWTPEDDGAPAGLLKLIVRFCAALVNPPSTVRLRPPSPTGAGDRLPFTADVVGAWLADVGPLADRWRLENVHPMGPEDLVATFADEDGEEVRVLLRPRDDARPAALRTVLLDVSYREPFGRVVDAERTARRAEVARELALHLDALEARGDVEAFEAAEPARDPAAARRRGPPPAINLSIPGPCEQRCAFCAVHEEIPAMDEAPEPFVRALEGDLERAARLGARTVRVNGLEPLAAPYALRLLSKVTELGFESVHLLSTCLPLADVDYARRVFAAIGGRVRVYVPIYGASPEVHDPLVGRPGAFDLLMDAMRNMREVLADREGAELVFTTILMRDNASDMAAMADLVRPLGRWWEVHLPFPNTSSAADRYREIALPMRQALEAVYPRGGEPLADLPLGEVLPCVALAHQRLSGHWLVTARRVRQRQPEPSGTFYETVGFTHSLGGGAFTSATTPCPHRDVCTFARACPGKVYAAYAERFGLGELTPVTRAALEATPGGSNVLWQLDAEEAAA